MNSILLDNAAPDFLEREKISQSEIWLRHVEVHKGERVQLVAPSGSGKSSLIHFLYGLRKDFHGAIQINGKSIKELNPPEIARIRSSELSIIFQDLRLFADQTAYENINIKKLLNPFHQQDKIPEMANRLGIGNKLDQVARTCSYGEQQRIAIIRALQQPFDFILMDEPFSHLDENNRKKAMDLIEEEAQQRGAAIILADLKPIEYFNAQRILRL